MNSPTDLQSAVAGRAPVAPADTLPNGFPPGSGPIVEEGTAFLRRSSLERRGGVGGFPESRARIPASTARAVEHRRVVVIGAGQAGLSVGYHLARHGIPFVILDAGERVGDSWRRRWDSLRLFTPARFDGLDGMPFPGPGDAFPSKDEMADYLEAYAGRFALPVRCGVRVERVWRRGDRYLVDAGNRRYEAAHVIVAMANYQRGRVPEFARDLDPGILQLHSSAYRNASQLRAGGVLVVGAGNSGAEIAAEIARGRPTWLAGRETGEIPFRIEGLAARLLLARLIYRVVFHRILTVRTPIGRRARARRIAHGAPLIRVRSSDLAGLGVERVGRVAGTENGKPRLEDGRVLDASNVIWCTGFRPDFSWIDLPVFGEKGQPVHERGIVETEPGLYFVGVHFLYAFSSTMIHGVGRDARHVAEEIARRELLSPAARIRAAAR